jgi:dynein heavy chain
LCELFLSNIIFFRKKTQMYHENEYIYRHFVEEKLGGKYTSGAGVEFASSFEESGPATPMFFILSAGVNPLKDVEMHGKKIGWTEDNSNFHIISLGQGQEVVAEKAMDVSALEGHWVVLEVCYQRTIS